MSPLAILKKRKALVLPAILMIAAVGVFEVVSLLSAHSRDSTSAVVGPTTFEQLLHLVPKTSDTIASVEMIDFGRLYSAIGVSLPAKPLREEDVPEFERRVVDATVKSNVPLGILVTGLGHSLVGELARPARIGYSTADVQGHVYAGADRDAFADDHAFEAVIGRFDQDAVSRAISTCADCGILPEFSAYLGVRYVAWGEDFRNHLRIRYAAPAFDDLGKGGRLAASEDFVRRTNWSAGMEAMIATALNQGTSLGDDPYFVSVARALASREAVLAYITCQSNSVDTMRQVIDQYWPAERERAQAHTRLDGQAKHALRRYVLTGTGLTYMNGEEATVLVLAHEDEARARENAVLLRQRIQETTNSRGNPWAPDFDSVEIRVEGNLLVVRFGGYSNYRGFEYESLLLWDE